MLPSVVAPACLPHGLKIGMVAAAFGVLFTLWQLLCIKRYQYPLLHFLPDMPATSAIITFLGGVKEVVFSLPMLGVLALAGLGLTVSLWDWYVSRRAGRHKGLWLATLGFTLNLLPFVLFAKVFVSDITAAVME